MDTQCAAAAFRKNREVAARLSRFHNAKSVLLSWNPQVLRVVTGDLQEDAAVGPAFVRLSGGVQEARTETKNRGHFLLVADRVPDRLQRLFILRVHGDISEHSKVIAWTDPAEMCLQDGRDIQSAVNRRDIFLVGEKLDAPGLKKRHF